MCEPKHRSETSNHFQALNSKWSNWGIRCLVSRRDSLRGVKETKRGFGEVKQRVDGLEFIFEKLKRTVGVSDYGVES